MQEESSARAVVSEAPFLGNSVVILAFTTLVLRDIAPNTSVLSIDPNPFMVPLSSVQTRHDKPNFIEGTADQRVSLWLLDKFHAPARTPEMVWEIWLHHADRAEGRGLRRDK